MREGTKHSKESKIKIGIANSENAKINPNYGMRNKNQSKETRKKMSLSHKGEIFSKKHKRKMSIAKLKNPTRYWKDKKRSEETKRKMSIAHKKNARTNLNYGMSNKSHSEKTKIKMSLSRLERKKRLGYLISEEAKRKLSIAFKTNWQNAEFRNKVIKNILKGLLKRPTSFEQKISNLCFKFNLPFIYTGNGNFLINFKNPDFVNEKDKIVIEVFYSWFKIRDYGSVENYKEFCRKKYNPKGWRVIFLDENDVCSDNWEEVCLNKIRDIKKLYEGKIK